MVKHRNVILDGLRVIRQSSKKEIWGSNQPIEVHGWPQGGGGSRPFSAGKKQPLVSGEVDPACSAAETGCTTS